MINNTPTDIERAYIAGYVDGEGCIMVVSSGSIGITICNTHKPTLEWIQSLYGGYIYQKQRKNEHSRETYQLMIIGKLAFTFFISITPFLREKKEQAFLVMKYNMLPRTNSKTANNTLVEREQIKAELKRLKRVGY